MSCRIPMLSLQMGGVNRLAMIIGTQVQVYKSGWVDTARTVQRELRVHFTRQVPHWLVVIDNHGTCGTLRRLGGCQ
jgi:hypothetical protein